MTKEEAKEIIESECYVFNPLDFDRTTKINTALDVAVEALEQKPTTKNNLGVDWDELKRKILMEVDGGTDDAWLAYGEVCDRISNSIDEFVADMREVEE